MCILNAWGYQISFRNIHVAFKWWNSWFRIIVWLLEFDWGRKLICNLCFRDDFFNSQSLFNFLFNFIFYIFAAVVESLQPCSGTLFFSPENVWQNSHKRDQGRVKSDCDGSEETHTVMFFSELDQDLTGLQDGSLVAFFFHCVNVLCAVVKGLVMVVPRNLSNSIIPAAAPISKKRRVHFQEAERATLRHSSAHSYGVWQVVSQVFVIH